MSEDYNPNSVNAVLSRIETKLNQALATQEQHSTAIRKLWTALGRLDVRVALIAGGMSGVIGVVKLMFFSHG
jgi:hypothetical protein